MLVLVVDDAVTARMMITSILKDMGFSQIRSAEDGVRALELLADGATPGLVFVDWNMPAMNGLELVKRLRADEAYSETRILMVTTETGMNHVAMALDAGADEYVMKPFTKDILLDKLRLLGIESPAWH